MAVFTLPPEMIGFYKHHVQYLSENAVNPDKRRYAVEEEAARHYIDIDVYGDSAVYHMPRYWKDAVQRYPEDTLKMYGIVPWYVNKMRYRLTDAMRVRDAASILRLSAELGHYVADANVPLHTTENYNGQLTGQKGIHGLWESRLTELFATEYDFFVGKASYLERPQVTIWNAVIQAHEALDSVLFFEKELTTKFGPDKKYGYETRGNQTIKTYSYKFSQAYHRVLNGMVERQMLRSVKMTGDFWYTCWVDAGQPDLQEMIDFEFSEEELAQRYKELEEWKKRRLKSKRKHESGVDL
ncbi:zinc dependent phospholipase C family protein [Fulvivirga sp. M361]|uniref:zinc dependent phospholipase C family protein n=1 Tax=Fulvivirga sp. M361 TaxID=2594266 RepID=UPI00351B422F